MKRHCPVPANAKSGHASTLLAESASYVLKLRLKTSNVSALRLKILRRCIRESAFEGIILVPGPNLRYYAGVNSLLMERPFLLFVPKEGDPHLVAPRFEAGPYTRTHTAIKVHPWSDAEGPSQAFTEVVRELRLTGKWGVEGRAPYRFLYLLTKHARPDLEDAEQILQSIREVKDPKEIQLLQRAASILCKSFLKIPGIILPGMTEIELARKVTQEIYSNDAELVDDVLVQSGPFAADPHHLPESRKIRREESIVVDATCTYSGYYADITRTFMVGKDREFQNLYMSVLNAQEKAIGVTRPGSTTGHIDDGARSRLKQNGLDRYFTHRTGHGLGLEVHEAPYIIPNGSEVIQPSMAFTVEPGVYIPTKIGVRIEDDVLVAQNGAKVLSRPLPKEFGWWR
jgi:Xaa-Pro dipeptidase